MTDKIKAILFEITGGEAEPEGGWPKPATSWADFHWQLNARVQRAPKNGGYDKTSVRVTWADGETFEARLDIDGNGSDADMAKKIRRRVRYAGGLLGEREVVPRHWAFYQTVIERAIQNGDDVAALEWLERYEVPPYDLCPLPNNGSAAGPAE